MTYFKLPIITALIFSFASPALADESEVIVKLRETIQKAFVKVEAVIFKKEDAPKPVVPTKCECNGTGFITHGDGHKTPCPNYPGCTKGAGQVLPKAVIEVPKVQPAQKLNAYIEMYSLTTCGPCNQWKDLLKDKLVKSGWTVKVWEADRGETPRDKREKYSRFPAFEVYIDGNMDVVNGFLTVEKLEQLKKKYNK